MSTLRTTNIQHPDADEPNIVLAADGGVTIDDLTATGLVTGKVLQVVSTNKTDTFASNGSNSTFQTVTGLSVTITPSSATSKILVSTSEVWFPATANVTAVYLRVIRGATPIGVGDAAGSRQQAGFGSVLPAVQFEGQNFNWQYLDSPATTSATTYTVQVSTNSTVARLNYRGDDADSSAYARWSSTITVQEIGA